MVYAEFLVRPHQNTNGLKIVSWNINGAKSKLENINVYTFLSSYDIVCLNEVKTSMHISFPGYVSFKSKHVTGASSLRGGTVVFVKNYLSRQIYNLDNNVIDQVWFQIQCVPDTLFGFCYVPPTDSQYFNHQSFVAIHEKLLDYKGNTKFFIIGDLNARFGSSVRNISLQSKCPDIKECLYPYIPDDVSGPNDNAYLLSTVCIDHSLLVLNNVKTPTKYFPSQKTFKRRDHWISELDTNIVSYGLLDFLSNFTVHHTNWLPSDHAPISVDLKLNRFNLDSVLVRASNLGGHGSLLGQSNQNYVGNKPIKYNQININDFSRNIADLPVPNINITNVDSAVSDISQSLYEYVCTCRTSESHTVSNTPPEPVANGNLHYSNRWERILNDPDDSRVWKALNWKGEFTGNHQNCDSPSDVDFKQFYESQSNQHANASQSQAFDIDNSINIPILDDQFTPVEVSNQIDKMKANKTCGLDGIPPGVYKLLTPPWIVLITLLFNIIFTSASYPIAWTRAKLFMLFKCGSRNDPNNYRGISVINSIAKLYDMVLCNRLELWFKPYREQAGAQKGRGCLEHIVTLRLLADYSKKKKKKLFITFVDFSKAYDLVPRQMLFTVLKNLGCGAAMLSAIVAMYSVTQSVIGTAMISTFIGVRQGSPTSCFLFIVYVNDLVKLIKNTCESDGFLSWLHLLILMDDTVLLATSRENMIKKVKLLTKFCDKYGMIVNEKKTKLMVINGSVLDREPININSLSIKHCDLYTYLGSPFTSDGSVSSAIKAHAQEKIAHFYKFVSFLAKNGDLPFIIKKRVFDACLMSALLYGCESWLDGDLKPMCKLYNWALKQMLGVRYTTCNDVCYVESGYIPLKGIVKNRQRKFFMKLYNDRVNMLDDPFGLVLRLVMNTRYNTKRYINDLVNNDFDDIQNEIVLLKRSLSNSESTKRTLYCNTMNPGLETHDIYSKRCVINETHRIAFTRFRVSSHSLAIETGRWNRRGRGRLPIEERLCMCGQVQTEDHVVRECTISQHIRNQHGFSNITELMSDNLPKETICKVIFQILNLYI